MPQTTPFILVSPRMFARIDTLPATQHSDVRTETVEGHHAIWTAHIPYIPTQPLAADGANTFSGDANNRIRWLLDRQIRFLYDLAQITNHQATFELRYIADPRPGTEARVSIVLLGKTFSPDPGEARRIALAQWERVRALFPSEPPYHYPLVPVVEPDDPPDVPVWEMTSFAHWFEPIAEERLISGQYGIFELRKHEDWPTLRYMGNAALDLDYIAHPFVPLVDYTSMARLLATLARQTLPAWVGIKLRPQRLSPHEEVRLTTFADWYQRAAAGELINTNPIVVKQREMGRHDYDAYFRQRAELGKKVYEILARERQSLLLYAIHVVAVEDAVPSLKEALGSELIANSGTAYPCTYDSIAPQPGDEAQWARFNLHWLEMERWGLSSAFDRLPDLARLRFLVTVPEAIAAFRLPTAPPGGDLPGIGVHDEPFTAIPTTVPLPDDVIGLGHVLAGGIPQPIEYRLPRSSLAGGMLLCGDDDQTRAETLATVVTYLAEQQVPTVVMGPNGSPTLQAALSRVGPAEAASSFRIPTADMQGALPPLDGVEVSRWADALARAFALAFDLPTRVSQVLRLAVLQASISRGVQPNGLWSADIRPLTLTDVAEALVTELANQQVSGEAATLLRDRCLPGLRELHLLSRGAAYTAPPLPALAFIQNESGGVHESVVAGAALNAACALAALERAAGAVPGMATPRAALVLVEPQHVLPAQRNADQPLLPAIERLRQLGGTVVLVTSRPHLIDPEALPSQVHAAQRLSQSEALAACQRVMGLQEREARRLATLPAGDTVWKRDDATVLVRQRSAKQLAVAEAAPTNLEGGIVP